MQYYMYMAALVIIMTLFLASSNHTHFSKYSNKEFLLAIAIAGLFWPLFFIYVIILIWRDDLEVED